MDAWGATTYGDPCTGCGFEWSTTLDHAVGTVERIPVAFGDVLRGATGHERREDLMWSVGSYTCHVADNLRIWAERLAGVAAGAPLEVGAYDENELAHARRYEAIPLPAALWSLRRSADDWVAAVAGSRRDGVVLIHPVRGELTLADIAVANAHDAVHHLDDVELTLAELRR